MVTGQPTVHRWPNERDEDPPPLKLEPEHRLGPRPNGREGQDAEASNLLWQSLAPLHLTPDQCDRGRLISHGRDDPTYVSFDMLRTRTLHALRDKGWNRIAVTSPTEGCGKTFVSSNLALSLARTRNRRAVLVDMDLRRPGLAKVFGARDAGRIADFLDGTTSLERHFRRVGERLAVALNGVPVRDPSETLLDSVTGEMLDRMQARLRPDVVVYDMPPMLACDDTLAFLPQVDCVLLIAGGGLTYAEEITRCAKLLDGQAPVLGVALNRAEDREMRRYYYY